MNIIRIPCLLILLILPVQNVQAGNKLTLESALDAALNNSPQMHGIKRELALREADSLDAIAFENPELELDSIFLERNSSKNIGAEVTVPLKPSLFSSRQDLAKAIDNIGSMEERLQILSLKHRVTEAYLELWIIQEHSDFLSENIKFARSTKSVVSDAARRGEVGNAPLTLFNAEVLKYEDELLELEAEAASARIKLFKLINLPINTARLATPSLTVLPKSLDLIEQNLQRKVLEARKHIADANYKVAKQDMSFPEFSPRFKYNEGFDDDSRTASVGIRLQLPFGTKNKAEVTRARAERSYAEANLRAYDEVGYEQLINQAFSHTKLMHSRVKQYQNKIIPAYESSFNAIKQMFQNGQASVIELWQVHERLHDSELKRLDVIAHAFAAEIELEALMGKALQESAGE